MDIEKLQKLNRDAIAICGRYEISRIQSAMGATNKSEVERYRKSAQEYIEKMNAEKDRFNLLYKDVRDVVFKSYKKNGVSVAGFARRIGDDGHTAYYAAGLYDVGRVSRAGLSALEAAEEGYGVVIAIIPQPLDKPVSIIESEVYGDIINVFDGSPKFDTYPLEIKNYKNFVDYEANFESSRYLDFDALLWDLVEKKMVAQKVVGAKIEEKDKKKAKMDNPAKIENKEVQNKENDEHRSSINLYNKRYVRPYTSIGHYNEAKEGKSSETER